MSYYKCMSCNKVIPSKDNLVCYYCVTGKIASISDDDIKIINDNEERRRRQGEVSDFIFKGPVGYVIFGFAFLFIVAFLDASC